MTWKIVNIESCCNVFESKSKNNVKAKANVLSWSLCCNLDLNCEKTSWFKLATLQREFSTLIMIVTPHC
ncbi:CLUMA_CG013999, isoform A [Clunio marinus]|uniref:CLUMA_CG013999, isoform A n=1 Tax=Clunio marinus TaxID=568069 RepID=A0A1J1IKH9_9DIPT|nr:CLUMA_CG013999, isoform A [Clunio marinus]